MKKFNLITLVFLFITTLSSAQHAGNCIGLNGPSGDYATVNDDADFDITNSGITIEMWVRPTLNVTDDQKLLTKSGVTFPLKSSIILGIIDGQVLFEVYDEDSETLNVKAGSITFGAWNHIAGTFDTDTKIMKVYVNGDLVGENYNENIGPFTYVTNPLILGAPNWNLQDKNFTGYMDEVRFWSTVLDGGTIRNWMLNNVTDSHPNWQSLEMYHKYNEESGDTAYDSSPGGQNGADITGIAAPWITSKAPFKGDYNLLSGMADGLWAGHTTAYSGIWALSSNEFTGETSVLIANDEKGYGQFFSDGPGEYGITLGQVWKATVQNDGVPPSIDVECVTTPLEIENVAEIVLIGAPAVSGFSTATVFEGYQSGNNYLFPSIGLEDGWYYTLAFKIQAVGTEDLEESAQIDVFPNPTSGNFQVNLDQEKAEDISIRVININGQIITQQEFQKTNQFNTSFDLENTAPGIYTVQIQSGDRVSNKRITVY